MFKFIFLAVAMLSGCTVTTRQLEGSALQQVRSSIAPNQGDIKFANSALWVPNSKEFKINEGGEANIPGVLVITEKNVIFQQWGGTNGLTTLRQIPFVEINDASLISFGLNKRLVIRSNGNKYDSFSASGGDGQFVDSSATVKMNEIIFELRKQMN